MFSETARLKGAGLLFSLFSKFPEWNNTATVIVSVPVQRLLFK
jgi:hypothetical protein